jgi:[histone H3]-lysine4 N-trimethyltransferase SETD1
MLPLKPDPRSQSPRRAGSLQAGSSVNPRPLPPSGTKSSRSEGFIAEDNNNINSTDNDGKRPGDILNGVESTSSLASPSSLFPNTRNMSYTGQPSSLHALTPLTSSESSPPGKLPSPRSAKPPHETMHATSASQNPPPADIHVSDTMTPVQTPPEERISVFPTDGRYGMKIIVDPMLNPRIAKSSRQPHYKPIERKVCDIHNEHPQDVVVL